MNDDTHSDAADPPFYLNNEANPDSAVFSGAAPAPTAAALTTSTIVPHAHISPSGQKHHTKQFSPVNTNKNPNKDTIVTTPVPDAPTAAPADAYSLSPGLIVSNYSYSLRNHNFPTSSISNKKPQTRQKYELC